MSDNGTQPVEQPAQSAKPSEPAQPAFVAIARNHNIILSNDGLSHRHEFRWQLAGLASGRLELCDGLLHEPKIN